LFVLALFFSCSSNSSSDDSTNVAPASLLMSGNFNGVQMNNMKPAYYPSETSVVYDADHIRFLWLQGNGANGTQLNIYIPDSQWAVGTYDLLDHDVYLKPSSNVWLIENLSTVSSTDVTKGTISITEFNLVTKKIKGTFSFQYNNFMKAGGPNQGPYQVSNGTFDYNLDDKYFK
ncbi:MAG: hypothetical protein QG594_1181, partial [Bacteroidota bacterium]|nr:hypothetical protein [Bacteroidota bacterium]